MKRNEAMKKYILLDALVAEIKARINDIEVLHKAGLIKKGDADKKILLFKSVLSLIDTLEVKEINPADVFVEKACEWLKNNLQGVVGGSIYIEDFRNYIKGE